MTDKYYWVQYLSFDEHKGKGCGLSTATYVQRYTIELLLWTSYYVSLEQSEETYLLVLDDIESALT